MTKEWTKLTLPIDTSLEEYLAIIEDATCYGFEFKVENYEIFFREIDT